MVRYTIRLWTPASHLDIIKDKKGRWVKYSSYVRELREKQIEYEELVKIYTESLMRIVDGDQEIRRLRLQLEVAEMIQINIGLRDLTESVTKAFKWFTDIIIQLNAKLVDWFVVKTVDDSKDSR